MKRFIANIASRMSESNDFIKFLWKSKMWLLIPFILILVMIGGFLFFVQASGVAPFIYTLF